MKTLFTTIILMLIGIGLSCQKNYANQLTAQELKIYKTILGDKPKEVVVIDESIVGVFGEISTGGLKEILKGLQDDTFNNLAKINSNPTIVETGFEGAFDYPILSRAEFEKKKLNPGRYYVFSRIGFSNDGRQAVVMFIEVCDLLCGKGTYFLLKNNNGFWEIEKESEAWRS